MLLVGDTVSRRDITTSRATTVTVIRVTSKLAYLSDGGAIYNDDTYRPRIRPYAYTVYCASPSDYNGMARAKYTDIIAHMSLSELCYEREYTRKLVDKNYHAGQEIYINANECFLIVDAQLRIVESRL